ncbi:UNVERIFIED_CONTAM: hypothetical protein NCL1_44347 [Trichonephila clavipes]
MGLPTHTFTFNGNCGDSSKRTFREKRRLPPHKNLILARFQLTPMALRGRFESHQRRPGAMWADLVFELRSYLDNWLAGMKVNDFATLKELLVIEQIKKESQVKCNFKKRIKDSESPTCKVEEGKEINEYKSSDCEVKVKTGEFEGSVRAVAMGGQQVINPDDIGNGSLELIGDKGVANPEGLICENICDEKYTIGTLMSCEKQLTVDRESFRNHAMAKIAEQLNREKENMKRELANLIIENSSEGIVKDSEILYLGNLRESQLYFKLPPDRSSYLRMINTKKKEGFQPDPVTIVLRQKDIN